MKSSVLVVDNQKLVIQLVTLSLANDYNVIPVSCGLEAMGRLVDLDNLGKLNELAAVILDVVMSNSNGFELLGEIRDRFPKLPVLMCTALDMKEDISQAIAMGATGYIEKPFNGDILRAKLSAVTSSLTSSLQMFAQ